MVTMIARHHGLSSESFEKNFLFTKTPVVIEGLAEKWPALSNWNPEYFKKRWGKVPVPVRDCAVRPYVKLQMRLKEYLDYWENLPEDGCSEKNLYLAEWNFTRDAAELCNDFETPFIFSKDWIHKLPLNLQFGRMWIFIGHPQVFTPVHTDTFQTSAWLTMIHGQKRVRFIAPHNGHAVVNGMDLFDVPSVTDFEQKGIEIFEALINQSDTLFIPGGWFHQVNNGSKNIMLTANFVDDAHVLEFISEFKRKLSTPLEILIAMRDNFSDQLLNRELPPTTLPALNHIDTELKRLKTAELEIDEERRRLEGLKKLLFETNHENR